MARMTEDQIRAITDAEMQSAIGFSSGVSAQRQRAMQYYYGEAVGDLVPPEVDGRSSVVSPDVRNTIEGMLPQLMQKFAGTETPVEFEATKEGDEPKAEQATDYCSYIFNTKNHGDRITYSWMKDALLSKNGIIKVWWDDSGDEKREEYKGLSDVELADVMDDEEVEIIDQTSYPDEEDAEQRQKALEQLAPQLQQAMQAAQMGDPQAGQSVQQIQQQMMQIQQSPPVMLFDIACKRKKKGQVKIDNVPPEEFHICRDARSIEDSRFHAHRFKRTRSYLKSRGYKNVDNIGTDDGLEYDAETVTRDSFDNTFQTSDDSMDESQRQIWVTECYIRVDYDGDGIGELRKVVRAGGEVLENEVIDCSPFVSITPVPLAHRFFGLSVADLAAPAQQINTALMRGVLDNTWLQINGRYFAVDGQVNLDDLMNSRPGGVVRMKSPGMAGRLDQGAGDSQLGLTMLEYMKGFNEESTGFRRVSNGSDQTQLSQPISATQATIVDTRGDLRLDLIARNFAEGFRELFRLILKLCANYDEKEVVVKLRGKWVTVSPREWRNGFDAVVNVGLGAGNKDQRVAHLMALTQQQQVGLQIGTATPKNVFEAQEELAKAMGFKSGARFFTDPGNNPVPQAPDPEQAKSQTAIQIKQMELQADAQKVQAQMELERQKAELANQTTMHAKQAELEVQAANDARDSERERERFAYEAQLKEREFQFNEWKARLESDTKLAIAQLSYPVANQPAANPAP